MKQSRTEKHTFKTYKLNSKVIFFVKHNLCLTNFPKFKKKKFKLTTKELEEEVIS
jgi:hypothetical protein